MRDFKSNKRVSALALLALILTLAIVHTATASPTKVFVNPPIIIDPSLVPDSQFTIDITVDYVVKLLGYQFLLWTDPAVLMPVSWTNGPFLSSAGGVPGFYPGAGWEDDPLDPNYGWLYLVVGLLPTGLPPTKYPTGGGVLATVTFQVMGVGSSPIILGNETGLLNRAGSYQFDSEWCYGWYPVPEYPGGPITWEPYQPWRDKLYSGRGVFSNEPGPELYVRRRGAHGTSGSWPEWTVGTAGDGQTLYCRIMNYGFLGADVYVNFTVTGAGEVQTYKSNEDFVAAAIAKGEPSEVTVSASFPSGPPGKYRVMVVLYFRAGVVAEYTAYYLLEAFLGGEGLSRDIPVSFKTV